MATARCRRLAAIVLLIGCAGLQADCGDPAAPGLQVIDTLPLLAQFYDLSRDQPAQQRVAAFKAWSAVHVPGYYDADRMGFSSGAAFDQAIMRALDAFAAHRARWVATAAELRKGLCPAYDTFQRAFPMRKSIAPVYIVHSLGELDGGTRLVAGRTVLVFGVDVIELVHDFSDETPFVHHELFHVYHEGRFGPCEALWCAVWAEGLAVVAAQSLNPRATDAQLLLTRPAPLRPAVEAHLAQALTAVRALAGSREDRDYAAVLGADSVSDTLPPRFGYYVGYLIVTQAMQRMSLVELADLSARAAEPVFRRALDRLALQQQAGSLSGRSGKLLSP